jgi:hypothetical protein
VFFSQSKTPSAEDLLDRPGRLVGSTTANGTIVWTSPTGHTYTTYPGSRHLFPALCAPTATLWTGEPPVIETSDHRGLKMPKRRHTRDHSAAKAIAAERRLNDDLVAEHNKPPPF